jgi:hypothetical protein
VSPNQTRVTTHKTNKQSLTNTIPVRGSCVTRGPTGTPSFRLITPSVGWLVFGWRTIITHAFCRVRSQACRIHPMHWVLRGAHVDACAAGPDRQNASCRSVCVQVPCTGQILTSQRATLQSACSFAPASLAMAANKKMF